MSLQEKYTYPHYKDEKTELAQVIGKEKTKLAILQNFKSCTLSTNQQGLSVFTTVGYE